MRLYIPLLLVATAAAQDLAQFVNPFIGTGAGAPDYGMGNSAGNTPPGAAYPFGMMLWSPDTTNLAGGYRYDHDHIQGFSLTHISGRGIGCYQDFPVMPYPGPIGASPGSYWQNYSAGFSHQEETASPGSYFVRLDNGTSVELAVTQRTGIARFHFAEGELGSVLLNAGGSAQGNRNGGTGIEFRPDGVLAGSAVSGDCGGWFQYKVYFAAVLDRRPDRVGVWSGDQVTENSPSAAGGHSGAYVSFDLQSSREVVLRIGLSYVSSEKALANLRAENLGHSFEDLQAAARQAWNQRLESIQVSGGTNDQTTVFYTALYHAFIHPSTFSDADGEYVGFDNQVRSAGRRTQYHNFASWDMYRSGIPLLAMIAPEMSDMIQSLVNDASQDPGGGLPRWQHANTNSGGMVGDGQDAVIAIAYALGARDFDTEAAFAAMERGASQVGTTSAGSLVRMGAADYLRLGYVSTAVPDSASRTLEYTTDDFAISQFAAALGKTEQAKTYLSRAQNWRNLFYRGYLVPRNADGSFPEDRQPWSGLDYVEGSMAQYSWMVPFNMRELIDRMGGPAAAIARLDNHLSVLNDGPWSEYAFMGNSPSLRTPWAYNFAGAPWKSQAAVRRALLSLFKNAPGGLPGNDDLGTLSSWVVYASIGLYPHIPGVAGLVVGSPIFPQVSLRTADGRWVQMEAPQAAADKPYVNELRMNGSVLNTVWLSWEQLPGSHLEFDLSSTPNPAWAADASAAPPSFEQK